MPMPKPQKGEAEEAFIERCMGDETMKDEYPDNDQRLAVCYKQWEDSRHIRHYRDLSMAHSDVRLEIRAKDEERIVGYAAVYYDGTSATEYDRGWGFRERIMPGAFDETLEKGDDVRGLFNHDPNMLLGRTSSETLRIWSDSHGLAYEITAGDTNVARDVVSHLKRGDLSGSSFAFDILDDDMHHEDGDDIYELIKVRLYDVGPVTFPAYESTEAGVRDAVEHERRSMERRYKTWQTRQRAKDDPATAAAIEKYSAVDVAELVK